MFRAHRHVRIERVALEHHRDVAILGSTSLTMRSPMRMCRRSDLRDRRSSAARSTCRSPTDRAGRGTRDRRCRARGRRPRRRRRSAWSHGRGRPGPCGTRTLRAQEPAAGVPTAQRRDLRPAVGRRQLDDTRPRRRDPSRTPRVRPRSGRRAVRRSAGTAVSTSTPSLLLEDAEVGDERAHRRGRER